MLFIDHFKCLSPARLHTLYCTLHHVTTNKGQFHCFDFYVSRSPKKPTKVEPRVTQIGPLQIHGNIKLEYALRDHQKLIQ